MGDGGALSTRGDRHMRAEDREPLRLGLAQGQSRRMMARVVGRAPRTTTRGHPDRACTAPVQAGARARQPGAPATSWIPGCGRMGRRIWRRAARPNRVPGVSNARILTTGGPTSRPRPSMWAWRYSLAAPCAAHGWRGGVRRARRAARGREGPTDADRFPT